jgi:hypothetical protein
MNSDSQQSRLRQVFIAGTPYLIILFASVAFLLATWGRMQMGDSSIDLMNGTMIKEGFVPYRDIYFYATPGTAYLSALVQTLSGQPIHVINILGAFVLFTGMVLVWSLGKRLGLSLIQRVVVLFLLVGLQGTVFTDFTHHAYDIVLSYAVIFLLFEYLTVPKRSYLFLIGILSSLTFFVTQQVGLALICLTPSVLVAKYLQDRRKDLAVGALKVFSFEILLTSLFVLLLVFVGKISLPSMISDFSGSVKTYSQFYTPFSVWRDPIRNVQHTLAKFTGKETNSSGEVATIENTAGGSEVVLPSYVKIITDRGTLVYSLMSLVSMVLITVLYIVVGYSIFKKIRSHQVISDACIILAFLLIIFFAEASVGVFQLNFSMVAVMFVIAFSFFRTEGYLLLKRSFEYVLFVVGIVYMVLSFGVIVAENSTKTFISAGENGESVWVSEFRYSGLASSLNSLKRDLEKTPERILIYPRASEIYYIVNKIPTGSAVTLAYSHPVSVFEEAAEKSQKSPVIVIFHPAANSPELQYSMNFVDPVLKTLFQQQRKDEYFTVFRHF